MARRMKIYVRAKKQFLLRYPTCACCFRRLATDVHHTRGRVGSLLVDMRFFSGVCRSCHEWIAGHPRRARECGLLCAAGAWNSPPRDNESRRLKEMLLP